MEFGTALWLVSDSSDVSLFLKYVDYNQCHGIVFCTTLSRNNLREQMLVILDVESLLCSVQSLPAVS